MSKKEKKQKKQNNYLRNERCWGGASYSSDQSIGDRQGQGLNSRLILVGFGMRSLSQSLRYPITLEQYKHSQWLAYLAKPLAYPLTTSVRSRILIQVFISAAIHQSHRDRHRRAVNLDQESHSPQTGVEVLVPVDRLVPSRQSRFYSSQYLTTEEYSIEPLMVVLQISPVTFLPPSKTRNTRHAPLVVESLGSFCATRLATDHRPLPHNWSIQWKAVPCIAGHL